MDQHGGALFMRKVTGQEGLRAIAREAKKIRGQ
jgi:hypothetical protein